MLLGIPREKLKNDGEEVSMVLIGHVLIGNY